MIIPGLKLGVNMTKKFRHLLTPLFLVFYVLSAPIPTVADETDLSISGYIIVPITTWRDSYEGGNLYEWVANMSELGTAVERDEWVATTSFPAIDEGIAGPYELGFQFPFFDTFYEEIYVCTNGFLTFDAFDGPSYTNPTIPKNQIPNNLIAAFWDDMAIVENDTTAALYYYPDLANERFVVEYYMWTRYDEEDYPNTFQIVIHKNGQIYFMYHDMNALKLKSCTVGIENQTGSDGLRVIYNDDYVANGVKVEITNAPGLESIPVNLNGDQIQSLSTDSSGFYHFDGLTPGGYYEVFPSIDRNYLFDPSVVIIDHLTEDTLVHFVGRELLTNQFDETFAYDVRSSRNCSWGDYDNDQYMDLFVANAGERNNLYHNNQDGTFTAITIGNIVNDTGSSLASSWADYNNDGYLDLIVGMDGVNLLYQNSGPPEYGFVSILDDTLLTFADETKSTCWADVDNDGDLDLMLTTAGAPNVLFKNSGSPDYHFSVANTDAFAPDNGTISFTGVWIDYDNDNDSDFYVVNETSTNNLYENDGDGNFTHMAETIISGLNSDPSQACSWGDYDNDGDLDLFVANAYNIANKLYRNDGNGEFTEITDSVIAAHEPQGDSQGCSWIDYDKDGDLDLFVGNFDQENFLYQNDGPPSYNFEKIPSGSIISTVSNSRGSAWADYDLDGDVDLFMTNDNEANFLYINNSEGNSNHWLTIKCVGVLSNASAIGTKVHLWSPINGVAVHQFRQITSQDGYGSQQSMDVEFGLAKSTVIDSIMIEWPSGIIQHIDRGEIQIDQRSVIVEPIFTPFTASEITGEELRSYGASWGDFNNDDAMDLFICNEEGNRLYMNSGPPAFQLNRVQSTFFDQDVISISSTWGDYNNDGNLDLFVSNKGAQNFLYENQGAPSYTFVDVADDANLVEVSNSFGACWGDYDNDGDLDLLVANIDTNNFLYQNSGAPGYSFTRLTNESGSLDIVSDGGNSSSGAWADYDNDGDLDLFVANVGNNLLYRNNGDGTFLKITDSPIFSDVNPSTGGSWGDYNNDGYLDLFVANDGPNFLYLNKRDGTFEKISEGDIVNEVCASSSSGWGDIDNDGDLDLVVTNGGISFRGNNFIYSNDGHGLFEKIIETDIFYDNLKSTSGCWADYDDDGDIDLIVSNYAEPNSFYINNTHFNLQNWVKINCTGTQSNASAIGTKVYVNAMIRGQSIWQMKEISSQTGFAAQNGMTLSFGLGNATHIDTIRIEWPSGLRNEYYDQPVDTLLHFVESSQQAGLRANFYADVTEGQLPLTVRFRNVSAQTGATIDSWTWDFNSDGIIDSTEEDPTWTYYEIGSFDVTMTVSAAGQFTDYLTRPNYVQVSQLVADFNETFADDSGNSNWSSWGDYNNDGYLDLFIANGEGQINFLYENAGNGTFIKQVSGVVSNDGGNSIGSNWGDYDNDGDLDLFVANGISIGSIGVPIGSNFFYKNHYIESGQVYFERINDAIFGIGLLESRSIHWVDFDLDHDLDIFVTNAGVNNPDYDLPQENYLYINQGNDNFVPLTNDPLVTTAFSSLASAWADFNNDGYPDVFIANYEDENELYLNQNGESFLAIDLVDDEGSQSTACDWGDYDNDGNFDLYVTNREQANILYRNDGPPNYQLIPVSDQTIPHPINNSLGCRWGDYNNDGDLDLIVTNGENENNVFYANNGNGTFTEITRIDLLSDLRASTHSSWVDHDNDGDIDLFIARTNDQENSLFENNGNQNHYLQIVCTGVVSNRNAIGTKIKVKAPIDGSDSIWQHKYIDPHSGYMTTFGLGQATIVDSVRIEWPTGYITELANVNADTLLTVEEAIPILEEYFEPAVPVENTEFEIVVAGKCLIAPRFFCEYGTGLDSLGAGIDLEMTIEQNGENFTARAAIPAAWVTTAGLWYRIRGEKGFGSGYYPKSEFLSVPVRITNFTNIHQNGHFPEGIPQEGWHTLALPYIPDTDSMALSSVFGEPEYNNSNAVTNWAAFQLVGNTTVLDETEAMIPESGYFIFHRTGREKQLTPANNFSAVTSNLNTLAQMELHPGWNLIAWPYAFSADLAYQDQAGTTIGQVFQMTDSSWNPVTRVRPFMGLAIRNKLNMNIHVGDVLEWSGIGIDQPHIKNAAAPSIFENELTWGIQWLLNTADRTDFYNWIGAHPQAVVGPDNYDQAEPPAVGDGLSLFFYDESDIVLTPLCVSLIDPKSDGGVWSMRVENRTARADLTLSWQSLRLPDQYLIGLVDISHNEVLFIEPAITEYKFNASAMTNFKVVVGSSEFVRDRVRQIQLSLPSQNQLFQNFPNPFNPTTTIAFDLAAAGPASLKIYNMAGQLVKTLVDEHLDTGSYQYVWNGENRANQPVSSGIYFYKLKINDRTFYRKMTFLK